MIQHSRNIKNLQKGLWIRGVIQLYESSMHASIKLSLKETHLQERIDNKNITNS